MRTVCDMRRTNPLPLVVLLAGVLLPLPGAARRAKTNWHTVKAPSAGTARAIGGYANGCLAGGVEVAPEGEGFQLIRLFRRRNFAHPTLADYLDRLGRKIRDAGLPDVLVGDLSQPRGGKMASGHSSHRIGLDADIWFTRPEQRDADEHFASMVDTAREEIDRKAWTPEKAQLLKLAAEEPEVARVFVHWVIKRELCASVEGDRRWLGKVRPWYGHDRHFHVRLRCPEGNAECVDQPALPAGDGCGTEDWFSRAAIAQRKADARKGKPVKAASKGSGTPKGLPEDCHGVLAAAPADGRTGKGSKAAASK